MSPLLYTDIPLTCLTGTATLWTRSGLQTVAVYSGRAIIEHFVSEGMTEHEACEYIDFNMTGAYVSDAQPIIQWEDDPDEVVALLSD